MVKNLYLQHVLRKKRSYFIRGRNLDDPTFFNWKPTGFPTVVLVYIIYQLNEDDLYDLF